MSFDFFDFDGFHDGNLHDMGHSSLLDHVDNHALFDNQGHLLASIDHNTAHLMDSSGHDLGHYDHNINSFLDGHGDIATHFDHHTGNLFDSSHNLMGSIVEKAGMPDGNFHFVDPVGQTVLSYDPLLQHIYDGAFNMLASIKNLWG